MKLYKILLAIVLVFIIHQVYLYNHYDSNTLIAIDGERRSDVFFVKINEDFSQSVILGDDPFSKGLKINLPIGKNRINIEVPSANLSVTKEIYFVGNLTFLSFFVGEDTIYYDRSFFPLVFE